MYAGCAAPWRALSHSSSKQYITDGVTAAATFTTTAHKLIDELEHQRLIAAAIKLEIETTPLQSYARKSLYETCMLVCLAIFDD
jgi:hypothetical protein